MKALDYIEKSWQNWLWQREYSAPYQQRAQFGGRIFEAVMKDLANGQLSLRAMSLVYTSLISLVPMLALSFSVLKGLGYHNQIEPALLNLTEPLGDKRFEIVQNLVGFVDNVKVGVLGVVGFAMVVFGVISMMQKIEQSFNFTWRVKIDRGFWQRISHYLSAIFVAPLLIVMSVGLATFMGSNLVLDVISGLPFMGIFIEIVGVLVPYFLMGIGFSLIYSFIPNTNVNMHSALIAGLVTAVIWKTMGLLFSVFIENSSSNVAIYSAFASIIIFMLYMYLGWLVLLVGASVAFYHQHPQNMQLRNEVELSLQDKEWIALACCTLVAQRFDQDEVPLRVLDLAKKLNMPLAVIEHAAGIFVKAGILALGQNEELLPAKPLAHIKINTLLELVRTEGSAVNASKQAVPALDDYLQGLRQHRLAYGEVTLQQFAQGEAASSAKSPG